MKKCFFLLLLMAAFVIGSYPQSGSGGQTSAATDAEKTKSRVFRPTKDQISQAQGLLRGKNLYTGEISGKYNPETRTAIKVFQKSNGLKATGTLNRATLEKLGIELTETQKAIPVSPDSFAAAPTGGSQDEKPRPAIFRATKDQIIEAQKILKSGGFYDGEETGKLDDATREGLKKYQAANGIKVTGTLNQITLEKMGIELTDRQKSTVGK